MNPLQPIVDIKAKPGAVTDMAGIDAADMRAAGLPYRPQLWQVDASPSYRQQMKDAGRGHLLT
jgi:hypothetical protein